MAHFVNNLSFCSQKKLISPCGCQRADFSTGTGPADKPPNVIPFKCGIFLWRTPCSGPDGGPDRTRTYDPRLIKAVL